MPVIARDSSGKPVHFTIRNVRYVSTYHFTLLSVDQLWHEHRVDARFRDLHHLQFPDSLGGITVPYDPKVRLNSITMVSAARLPGGHSNASLTATNVASASPARKSIASQPTQHTPANPTSPPTEKALLGFHSPKSTSHIEHMSASRACELLHRRSHMGHVKIRALPHACGDAPKLLSSAHAGEHSCIYCAQANIKKASHGSTLDTPADPW